VGNGACIVDEWHHGDTMHSIGKFISLFRKLGLSGYQIGGDDGYGHQLMDRMAEQGFYLKRVNNGAAELIATPAYSPNHPFGGDTVT